MVTPDMAVLTRMIWGDQDAACALADLVDPAAFQSKSTRQLFLLLAREAPKGFSPVSLRPIVTAEAPGCLKLLTELLEKPFAEISEDASHEHLAESLAAWGQVERLKRATTNASKALNVGTPYAEVRDTLDKQLTALDLTALSDRAYDDKQEMARRVQAFLSGETAPGLPFGFDRLDKKVTPMIDGNMVMVAGRPGVGKTTVMKNICRNAVRTYGEPCAYFTFEMRGEEFLPSMACMDAGISYVSYVRKTLTPWELKRFNEALEFWVNTPLFILNERSEVTPEWILRTMRRYRAMGVRRFFIDHLHRVRYETGPKGDIRLPIGNFARQLKSFGVDNACTEVVGCQLTKGDKHAEPSDDLIREANNILEEADKILMPWLALVAGTRAGDGTFLPTVLGGGRRLFAREAPKGSDTGEDPERVYIALGKQRVRDDDGFVAIPFNAKTGLMYEDTMHSEVEAVA